jgi:DinB superfamily
MEWVFTARALHFARGVPGALPGVEQDDVMKVVNYEARPWAALIEQYGHLRAANIKLFEGFDEAAWHRTGVASGHPVSVRALAYIIAGHERHHVAVIRERYLR